MHADWNFEKLPPSEHGRVFQALETGRLWELAAIHDQYGLSPFSYCCSNTLKGLKTWFEYGIETGKIQKPEPGSQANAAPEIRTNDLSPG